jgi:hypothetical protein
MTLRAHDRKTLQLIRSMREEAALLRSRETRPTVIAAEYLGALALGAMAIGALAIGALVIGKLAIGRARIKRLEIDELVVHQLRVTEELQVPQEPGPEH